MIIFGKCPEGKTTFHLSFTIPQNHWGPSHGIGQTLGATGLRPGGPWYLKFVRTQQPFDFGAWDGPPASLNGTPQAGELAITVTDPILSFQTDYPGSWGGQNTAEIKLGSCWNGIYGPCPNPDSPTIDFSIEVDYSDFYPLGLYPCTLDVFGQVTPFSPPP